MRSFSRFVLPALALLTVLIFVSPAWSQAPVPGQNLLVNPGFEMVEGNLPGGWSTHIYGEDDTSVEFAVDNRIAHSGRSSFRIKNIRENDSKVLQSLAVKPNTFYKLSGWVRVEGGLRSRKGASITVLDVLTTSQDLFDTAGAWQQVSLYGKTGPDQNSLTLSLRLGFYGSVTTGTAWFDDISLVELERVPEGMPVIALYPPPPAPPPTKGLPFQIPALLLALLYGAGVFVAAVFGFGRTRTALGSKPQHIEITLAAILAGALAFKLALSLPVAGFPNDIASFKGWSMTVAERGLPKFYSGDYFVDYPPVYFYVLWLVGTIQRLFSLPVDGPVFLMLVKLPAILCDLATVYLLFRIAIKKISLRNAMIAAMLYLANIAVVFTSSVFAQVDSVFTLIALAAVWAVVEKKTVLAAALYAVAVLTKPQAAMLAPIALFAVVDARDLRKILLSIAAFALTAFVIVLPFSVADGFGWIIKIFGNAISSYPFATLNAFNFYALFGQNWASVDGKLFGVPFSWWGYGMLILAVGWVLFILFKGKGRDRIWYAAFFLVAASFTFSVKMHERYFYPALVFLLLMFIETRDKRVLALFGTMTGAFFINIAVVLDNAARLNSFQYPTDFFVYLVSFLMVAGTGYSVWLGWRLYVRGKVKALKEREINAVRTDESSNSPLTERPPAAFESPLLPTQLGKRDLKLAGILTAVYAVIAFFNLGSFTAPQTFWKPTNQGEAAIADLGDVLPIGRISAFVGLGQGTYKVQFSDDGQTWRDGPMFEQKSIYEEIEARFVIVEEKARFVKVRTEKPGMYLHEVVCFPPEGRQPIPSTFVSAELVNSLSKGMPANLFDEPNKVAFLPGFFDGMYFDEIYHARAGYEYNLGLDSSETTHPPLGKLLIGIGIKVFGMTPFGWRFAGTLFGVIMVPIMYLFGFRLFKKSEYAFAAAFLFAFDFMHFAQTRIATIDTYGVFFIILSYYFMYQYTNTNFYRDGLWKSLQPLLWSGLCFALGGASKWIVLFGGLGLAVAFFASLFERYREYVKDRKELAQKARKKPGKPSAPKQSVLGERFAPYTAATLGWAVLVFIILPVVVYVAAYIPWFNLPGANRDLDAFIRDQTGIFRYHAELRETHPFSSHPFEWPIMKRPIWYYSGSAVVQPDQMSSIVSFGNPAVWWVGIPAFVAFLIYTFVRRDKESFFILAALAAQYLPWVVAPRKLVFIYHFFATVPFLVFAIVYVLREVDKSLARNKILRPWFRWSYLAVAGLLFAAFYPVLSGLVVPSWWGNLLRWLPDWVF